MMFLYFVGKTIIKYCIYIASTVKISRGKYCMECDVNLKSLTLLIFQANYQFRIKYLSCLMKKKLIICALFVSPSTCRLCDHYCQEINFNLP